MSHDQDEIICIGELLWDALPSGLFMGGAPLNVCVNLQKMGEPAIIASRIGDDRLGKELLRRLRTLELDTTLIQRDATHETGFVEVEIDIPDDPGYSIIQPVAWDFIDSTKELKERVRNAWGILFGSLGQRSKTSRESTKELIEVEGPVKIFDMNLRYPHIDRDIVERSIKSADMLKINDKELAVLQKWYDLSLNIEKALEQLGDRFEISIICLTLGAEGSALYMDGQLVQHGGYNVEVADTVGAGDAFLAAVIHGVRQQKDPDEILSHANAVGAFVASKPGAVPAYTVEEIEDFIRQKAS